MGIEDSVMRLDVALVSRGLAPSREGAKKLIQQGFVRVDGHVAAKASLPVSGQASLEVTGQVHPYVSRGGLKLARAIEVFGITPAGRVCIDVGASTGGFTDVLLQRGARLVYAVDVGKGQLHERISSDPRVVVMEGCNARALDPASFDPRPDLAVMDVSFISIRLILPVLFAMTEEAVVLVKPQFEAGQIALNKHGIVRDPADHERVLKQIRDHVASYGWAMQSIAPSPIRGGSGNTEYLAHLTKPCDNRSRSISDTEIHRTVQQAGKGEGQ